MYKVLDVMDLKNRLSRESFDVIDRDNECGNFMTLWVVLFYLDQI